MGPLVPAVRDHVQRTSLSNTLHLEMLFSKFTNFAIFDVHIFAATRIVLGVRAQILRCSISWKLVW